MKTIYEIIKDSGCTSIVELLELVSLSYENLSSEKLFCELCIMSIFIGNNKELLEEYMGFKVDVDELCNAIYKDRYN